MDKKNREICLSYLKHGFPYADPLIINTLYLSFHRNADQGNQRAYVSKNANGILEIKELMPNAGAIREYPFLPINKKQLAEA